MTHGEALDAMMNVATEKPCPRWEDGKHCFEVTANRGSKQCTCGLVIKLRTVTT